MKPFGQGGVAHIIEIEYGLCAPPLNKYPIYKVLGHKNMYVQTY